MKPQFHFPKPGESQIFLEIDQGISVADPLHQFALGIIRKSLKVFAAFGDDNVKSVLRKRESRDDGHGFAIEIGDDALQTQRVQQGNGRLVHFVIPQIVAREAMLAVRPLADNPQRVGNIGGTNSLRPGGKVAFDFMYLRAHIGKGPAAQRQVFGNAVEIFVLVSPPRKGKRAGEFPLQIRGVLFPQIAQPFPGIQAFHEHAHRILFSAGEEKGGVAGLDAPDGVRILQGAQAQSHLFLPQKQGCEGV